LRFLKFLCIFNAQGATKLTKKRLVLDKEFQRSGGMEKKELKHEIDVLIESIKKQADRMNTQESLSMVELEVLHHKIQKLYEKSILIHHLPATPKEPLVAPPVTPAMVKEPEPMKAETITEEPKKEVVTEAAEKIQEPILQPSPPPVKTETKPKIDLFGEETKSESKPVVKVKPEKDKGATPTRKPISDLPKAISINDKFRFINELFHGNATEFNIALNQINTCSEFNDADRYVSNIRDIYHWKEENEVVTLFLDLVERRFL
jgi:hypothetical protein